MPTTNEPTLSRGRRMIVLCAAATLSVSGVAIAGAPAFADTTNSSPHVVTISANGSWTVPPGVSSITLILTGAGGGNDPDDAVGGMGAVVTGDLTVVPGQSLYSVIGRAGGNGRDEGGGFTSGGHGGGSGECGNSGAGGGGSTGVYFGDSYEPVQWINPLIVAAGGGGGGGWAGGAQGGTGGWADLDNAGSGQSNPGHLGANDAEDSLGAGGPGDSSSSCAGGGGGGGGWPNGRYYDGNGGGSGGSADHRDSGGGGGGGVSYVGPSVANSVLGSATNPALGGSVVISYVQGPFSTTSYAAGSSLSVSLGEVFNVTPSITTWNGAAPAGTVSLIDSSSGAVLASQDASLAGSLDVWTSAVGSETVHLAYSSADETTIPSSISPDFTLTTTRPVAAVNLTADNLNWTFNAGTLTADLYGAATFVPMPTGTVGFYDGDTLISDATLNAGSFASISTTLSEGPHNLTVRYAGDDVYAPSDSDVLAVTTEASIVPIVSGGGDSPFPVAGSPIHIIIDGPVGAALPQTGSIRFLFDGSLVGETVKDDADGSRTVSIAGASVTAGDHIVTLEYSHDGATGVPVSEPLPVTVRKATAIHALDITTAADGTADTVHARVGGGNSVFEPTGWVTFAVDGVSLSPVAVGTDGAAHLSVAELATGRHTIAAEYSGDANFDPATAEAVTVTTAGHPTGLTSQMALAATGSDLTSWAMLAGAVLLAGVAFTALARNRRRVDNP